MEVNFVKLSPTENMTVIVTSPVEREKQLEVGTELIKYASLNAEQAGFLERPRNKGTLVSLRMMAGEFCGNGAMSAAVYAAWKNGIKMGESVSIPMEVSGTEGVLECRVSAIKPENGLYSAEISMPLPLRVTVEKYDIAGETYDLSTVELEGITHIIIPEGLVDGDVRKKLESSVDSVGRSIGTDAFGFIIFNEKNGDMTPLVVVRSADSICWERGCGSGSEAVGAYMAEKLKKSVEVSLKQPGGVIKTRVLYDKGIKSVTISGMVKIVAEGKAFL